MGKEDKISFKKLLTAQIIFWIGYFIFYSIFEGRFYGYLNGFFNSIVTTSFTVVIFYVHALYLFPKLLREKKYFQYFTYSLILLTVMVIFRLAGEYLVLSHLKMFGDEAYNTIKVVYRYAMGIITMVVSVPIKYMYDYIRLQTKQQQIINQQLEAEMKYLKLQINPHFLFNTLNNLLYLTKRKSDDAPGVVEKLADLMRYLLEKEEVNFVPLNEEIKFINSYLELERIRIPSININFVKDIDERVNIPPMLLIPLVENAFKHGIDKSSQNNYVNLELTTSDNKLFFKVENLVREEGNKTNIGGKGLENLCKRLELLYQNEYELKTEIDNDNFIAKLNIPIE